MHKVLNVAFVPIDVLQLGASIAVISLVRRQLDLWIVKVVGNMFAGSYTCFLTSDGDAWGCR